MKKYQAKYIKNNEIVKKRVVTASNIDSAHNKAKWTGSGEQIEYDRVEIKKVK